MEQQFKHAFKAPKTPDLALSVHNVGFQKCMPNHGWGPAVRDHYLIHYIVSGCGTVELEGITHHLGAGDGFLVRPDSLVFYQADEQNPWEYYWVGFSGALSGHFVEQSVFKDEGVTTVANGDRFRQALLEIYKAHGSDYSAAVAMAGYLQVALSLLMVDGATHGETGQQRYAQQGAELIHKNYAQPITVETIAGQVGVSRSCLYRAFQELYGCSPSEYLLRHRMGRACQLLRQTDLSIKMVALSVGFEDGLYFSRIFHRLHGESPSQYRQTS